MIRIFSILFCLLFPTVAAAERVLVQSGEHEQFSRLVLELDAQSDWTLTRVEGGYELSLARSGILLNIDKIFDKIPRTRIRSVSTHTGGSFLFIKVDCACHAEAFDYKSNKVVLDIKSGRVTDDPIILDRSGTTKPAEVAKEKPTSVPRLQTAFSYVPGQKPTLSAFLPERYAPRISGSPPEKPENSVLLEKNLDRVARVNQAKSELKEQIARAATQGLLNANITVSQERTSDGITGTVPSVSRSEKLNEIKRPVKAHLNVRSETSVDREASVRESDLAMTADGSECVSDAGLDIADWGSEESIMTSISSARNSLIKEFDKPVPASIEALAKTYLFAGFGAEAIAVLSAFDERIENSNMLIDLSKIMDRQMVSGDSKLLSQLECPSKVAMWAVLASRDLKAGEKIDIAAVTRTFSELPLHLRRLLGPKIAQKFLDKGDRETALVIRNAIARASGEHGASFQIMEAKIDLDAGNEKAAESELAELIAKDSKAAPEATILMLTSKIKRNEKVDQTSMELAAALAFEHRGTEAGRELERLYVLALAQIGNHDAAIEAIEKSRDLNSDMDLASRIADYYVKAAQDIDFLRIVMNEKEKGRIGDLSRDTRRNISTRLLDLGFPSQALAILNTSASDFPVDQMIIARAALESRNPEGALDALKGVENPEAQKLLAKAYAALGQEEAAASGYLALNMQAEYADSAWRAGDWEAVQEVGTLVQKNAAKLVLSAATRENSPLPTGNLNSDTPALSVVGETLDASREMRSIIDALMTGDKG